MISGFGSGAILQPQSTTIGNILNTKFNNIGFDYPTDETVRGVANLPEILKMNILTSFESIGIASQGLNYLVPPGLVVVDGYSKDVVTDVDLKYELGDTQVDIVKNTFGMYDAPPRIIPINNSNGIGIASVSFTPATKVVRLVLDQEFSDASQFPYVVGENVLVENLSVGVATTGKGYNSSDYGYSLFEVTDVRPKLGGSGGWIEYSLSEFLSGSDVPGNVDYANSAGRAVPESHFPIFEPVLKTNDYYRDEKVTSGSSVGFVERWNPLSEYLYIRSPKEFNIGDKVKFFL